MVTLIPVGRTAITLDTIVRSLDDGSDYDPRFRSLICEQYLIKIAQAPDALAALREILSKETDSFIKRLLLFHREGPSSDSGPIEWAIRCYRSRNQNRTPTLISAMVMAGRTHEEIAQEFNTKPSHIVAYEALCFDVRRYLHCGFWIKELCYSPGSRTGLGEDASRWLLAAYERGFDALKFTFSMSKWDPISKLAPNPASGGTESGD